jgi:branched-chain amino acid transport system substrate-binding protein
LSEDKTKKVDRRGFIKGAAVGGAVVAAAAAGIGGFLSQQPGAPMIVTKTVTETAVSTVAPTTATPAFQLSTAVARAIENVDAWKITKPLAVLQEWKSPPSQYSGKKEIVVGASVALTGDFAPAGGTICSEVYKEWVRRVNAKGGLLGIPVRLLTYDDGSDPATAISNFTKLIQVDKVDLLLSGFPTPIMMAVLGAVDKYNKLIFNGGSTTIKGFTEPGFSNNISTQVGAEAHLWSTYKWFDTLPSNLKPKKVAISYLESSPFNVDMAVGAYEMAKQYGYDVVLYEGYGIDTKDYTPVVQKAKSAGAEFYFGDHTTVESSTLTIKAMKELDYQPKAYWDFLTMYPIWLDPKNPDAVLKDAWYTITSSLHWTNYADPPFHDVVSWIDWYTKQMHFSAGPNWDYGNFITAPQMIEAAVQASGSLDNAALKSFIETHSFDLINGRVEFPPPWHVIKGETLGVAQILNGKEESIWPPDKVTAKGVYPRPPWNEY